MYVVCFICFFFCKQKTAYEMRISDWSSDVCSADLFQGFRSKDYNRWMFIPIFGDIKLSNVTTLPGTNQIDTATVTGAVRPDGYTGSFNGKTDTYQVGGGAIWKRDRLQISADVAYTDSQYTANLVNVDYAAARDRKSTRLNSSH